MSLIVVPDQTRKFPLQQVSLIDRTIDDHFGDLLAFVKANCPNWTDHSTSDLGTQVLWIQSVLSDWLRRLLNQAANNCFLGTVTDRYWLRMLCLQLDYTLQETSAATVGIRFALTGGHGGFTIPAGTQVATAPSTDEDAVVFETAADHPCQSGDATADVDCVQGETVSNEIVGSGTGSAGQIVYFRRRPVVWQSETVQVDEGTGFIAWTRVDHLVESLPTDRHYRLELDNSGYIYVHFGDGVNGKIPPLGTNNIRASYRKGGGTEGNVGATEITELISNVANIDNLSNPLAATGGEDQETITQARLNATGQVLTGDRIVTLTDVQDILRAYRSTTYGEIGPSTANAVGNLTTDVRFLPANGEAPDTAFKAEVKAYLDVRRMINTEVVVQDPNFTLVDYDVEIWIEDNYNQAEVVEGVRLAIVQFGSGHYKNADGLYPNGFGQDVKLSKLFVALMAVDGVQYCQVTTPASDTTIAAGNIRKVNSIDITANQGGTQSSFLSLETDL